eukprot:CAMPEP_0206560090 /NCGR_PEP_ID=MMETSP0325_2-20121206/20799_1 /ASSEMBLY_ACC=CAM_ASM_000347 /TAXON_ID=2866 /ORGANISM="Crypthecodinium cohnii, Strain Seligo" /LENGTH=382 /DNA_ID=CAMNT_0054061749 /DNA_START=18 /DNA_END=1166 /DNA_ORIENTATION=+
MSTSPARTPTSVAPTAGFSLEEEIPKLRFSQRRPSAASTASGATSEILVSHGISSFAGSECSLEPVGVHMLLKDKVKEHYRVGKQIGSGAYGKVYQVKERKTRKYFALKTVTLPDSKLAEDVDTEIITAGEFDHPHLLKLHAFFKEGNTYHLVFDLCRGGNLAEFLQEYIQTCRQLSPLWDGGLAAKAAAVFAIQMLHGLLYLHHHGYVHRDVKPHNYLRVSPDPNSKIKLADFGMCTYLEAGDTLKRGVGTRGFMAPEVYRGHYDHKVDVFSLGITIFSLCTDRVPVDSVDETEFSKNLQDILHSHRRWQEQLPQLVSMTLDMLCLDPRKRPSIKELLENNERWLPNEQEEELLFGDVRLFPAGDRSEPCLVDRAIHIIGK